MSYRHNPRGGGREPHVLVFRRALTAEEQAAEKAAHEAREMAHEAAVLATLPEDERAAYAARRAARRAARATVPRRPARWGRIDPHEMKLTVAEMLASLDR